MSDNSYPRESQELVAFEGVTVNGTPTIAFTYQLTRKSERPTGTWATPVTVGSGLGFMLQPVTVRDTYVVWVKVAQNGQNIVIEAAQEIVRT